MVVLALTPNGLREALQLLEHQDVSIWCGADAIPDVEFKALKGKRVSRFVYALANEGAETLADAISTIEEHHPGETVWIEHISPINCRDTQTTAP